VSLRAIVIDDEPLARERLRALIAADPDVAIVAEADNAHAAATLVRQLTPDIIFLDIEMPGPNGLDFLRELGGTTLPTVIFTTAHAEYALDAFGVNAADYLVKPLDEQRVKRAIERAKRLIAGGRVAASRTVTIRSRLAVRHREEIIFIKVDEVDWIAAEGNYARVHSGETSYLIRETLQRLEASLDPSTFVRVHRSAIVNIDRVRKLATSTERAAEIVLSTGATVPLGPSYRTRLEEIFGYRV
jgi:two-component system LytT family response regulator